MSSKKQSFKLNSTYVISSEINDMSLEGPNTLALVKSNFFGTQFIITN
jgi:hypothetical protein